MRAPAACLPLLTALWMFPMALLPCGGAAEEAAPGSVQAPVEDAAEEEAGHPQDPWEPMNRRIFAFNEGLDRWVLEPVAKGWDRVVPEPAQRSVENFFDNLILPMRAANDLLQGKPWNAYETVWRLALNSTAGVGGLFDPASHYEIYESDEEFGQTLGYWGVPPGPYLMLPLWGPSNPRDTIGLGVDAASTPQFWLAPYYVSIPASTIDIVNDRAAVLETIAAERAAAFDFYSAVRSAAIQYRENQVHDRDPEAESADDEDLYYFDEEDE